MTPTKLRILVSGLLVLCVARLVWPDTSYYSWHWGEGFSLSTLITLAGIWACSVWLWNGDIREKLVGYLEQRRQSRRDALLKRVQHSFRQARFTDDEVNSGYQTSDWRSLDEAVLKKIIADSVHWGWQYQLQVRAMKKRLKKERVSDEELTRWARGANPSLGSWEDLNPVKIKDLGEIVFDGKLSSRAGAV